MLQEWGMWPGPKGTAVSRQDTCVCVCARAVCVRVCVCIGTRTWRKKVHVAEFLIPSVPSLYLTQRKKKCTGCPGVSRWNEATTV